MPHNSHTNLEVVRQEAEAAAEDEDEAALPKGEIPMGSHHIMAHEHGEKVTEVVRATTTKANQILFGLVLVFRNRICEASDRIVDMKTEKSLRSEQ